MSDLPLISVVVLNYNGHRHLKDCFHSLQRLDYPPEKLELILVDNASADGSVDFMAEHFPEVRIIQNQSNVGFARGNNIGAAAAQGKYVAFLNNDTRVGEAWARELVQPMLRDAGVVCTASKMVDWEGQVVDFVKGVMNFYGFGHQKDHGRQNTGGEQEEPILFACGGSMLIDREVFWEAGGFDEDYFMYFEDVDLGWRLWLMGYQVLLVPAAITYHRQHATANRFFDYHKKTALYERNALYTIIKNYSQETLDKVLPVALLLAARRMTEYMKIDGVNFTQYHFTGSETSTNDAESVSKLSLTPLVAINSVIDNLPVLMRKRERVQNRRRRLDAEIFQHFGQPFRLVSPLVEENAASQYALVQEFGIAQLFEAFQRRVLVVGSHALPNADQVLEDQEDVPQQLRKALAHQGHEALLALPEKATSHWAVDAWGTGALVRLLQRISPDVVVACGAEALEDLAGCPFPLVYYSHADGRTPSVPRYQQPDLFLAGSVEEIIEPLDQFCRLPILRREKPPPREVAHQKSLGELFGEAWYHYQRGGIRILLKETRGFLRRGGLRVLLNKAERFAPRHLRRKTFVSQDSTGSH